MDWASQSPEEKEKLRFSPINLLPDIGLEKNTPQSLLNLILRHMNGNQDNIASHVQSPFKYGSAVQTLSGDASRQVSLEGTVLSATSRKVQG